MDAGHHTHSSAIWFDPHQVFYPHLTRGVFSGSEFLGFEDSAYRLGRPGFLTDQEAVSQLLRKYARRRVWDSITRSRMVTPGPSFITMLRSLRAVMAILAKEPILTETGTYQPRLQQRTYADMEGEIANTLATLPNFHAKVKLLSGEHVIRTNPAPEGLGGELFAARMSRITWQMRVLGYVRHYRQVEEEVCQRQERLRRSANADQPRPSQTGHKTPAPEEPPPTHF